MDAIEANADKTAKKGRPQPAPAAAPAAKTAESMIYLGPTITDKAPGSMTTFLIRHGTIFKNGLPADVVERQKKHPEFDRLFFPTNKAVTAMVEISKADSPLRKACDDVARARFARRKGA